MPPSSVRTKILVVSLASAAERRARFAERARDAPLPWQFFDAHSALSPSLAYEPAAAEWHHGRALQPGELGCYSSHFTIWETLLRDDCDQYIVLEDDVIIDWKMIEALYRRNIADDGFQYLRLYYKKQSSYVTVAEKYLSRSTAVIHLLGKSYGTQGYVIEKSGAERLVECCAQVRRPIDDQMDRYWEHGVANLSLFPFPIIEESVPSEIGMTRFELGRGADKLNRRIFLWRDKLRRRSAAWRIRFDAKIGKKWRGRHRGQKG